MRFLLLHTDYPAFLGWLYTQHPGLEKQPYEEQMRTRVESLFGGWQAGHGATGPWGHWAMGQLGNGAIRPLGNWAIRDHRPRDYETTRRILGGP